MIDEWWWVLLLRRHRRSHPFFGLWLGGGLVGGWGGASFQHLLFINLQCNNNNIFGLCPPFIILIPGKPLLRNIWKWICVALILWLRCTPPRHTKKLEPHRRQKSNKVVTTINGLGNFQSICCTHRRMLCCIIIKINT